MLRVGIPAPVSVATINAAALPLPGVNANIIPAYVPTCTKGIKSTKRCKNDKYHGYSYDEYNECVYSRVCNEILGEYTYNNLCH